MKTQPTVTMRYRPWLITYVRLVAIATILHGVHIFHQQDGWCMGDWLINYRAGFVRRGLMGEVALRIGHGLHHSPLAVVLAMQLTCYALMLYSVHRLLKGTQLQVWTVALLVSPATLGFQVLEPTGGFRKEILLLASLGVLILLLLRWPRRPTLLVAYMSVVSVVCVLSHESLILFAAYTAAALAIGLGNIPRAIKLSLLPAALAIVTFVAVSHHPGDPQIARGICASLGYSATGPLPPVCSGAIAYLGRDLSYGHAETIRYFRICHYGSYAIFALLALLPVFMAYRKLWRWPEARRPLLVIAVAALLSLAATSPLFFYAVDWGRWIYIHVFCIFLLLLLIERLRQNQPAAEPSDTPTTHPRLRKSLSILFLLVYATCWELPFVGKWSLPLGYVNIAKILITHTPSTPGR